MQGRWGSLQSILNSLQEALENKKLILQQSICNNYECFAVFLLSLEMRFIFWVVAALLSTNQH